MELQISLTVEKPSAPVREMETMPVYPMGEDLSMVITFANGGSGPISIDDPQTSQALYLMLSQEGPEDAMFMIHPSVTDATGETTGPIPSTVNLEPNLPITIPLNLYDVIVDKCFLPGIYDIYIEFQDIKSEPVVFGVEYRPESVPKLIAIAIDEQANSWVRDEAVSWLKKLPRKVEVQLPVLGEDETTKQVRVDKNIESARQYLDYWQYDRDPEETKKFFEQYRLQRVK